MPASLRWKRIARFIVLSAVVSLLLFQFFRSRHAPETAKGPGDHSVTGAGQGAAAAGKTAPQKRDVDVAAGAGSTAAVDPRKRPVVLVRGDPAWAKMYGPRFGRAASTGGPNALDIVFDWQRPSLWPLERGANRTVVGIITKCVSAGDDSYGHQRCMLASDYARLPRHVRVSALRGLSPEVRIGKHHLCEVFMSAVEGFAPSHVGTPLPRESVRDLADARQFAFPCYIMPQEREKMARVAREAKGAWPFTQTQPWILKAAAMHSGQGILPADTYAHIPDGNGVAMPLLHPPFLVNGEKTDMRTYVLITSMTPLRAYVHDKGLMRLSGDAYNLTAPASSLRQTQMLTNAKDKYAIRPSEELKWTLDRLRQYIASEGYDADAAFYRLRSAIGRLLLSFEAALHRLPALPDNSRSYALFGMDTIFNADLEPRVIEVNANCRMASMIPIEEEVMDYMVQDLLRLVYGGDTDECVRNTRRRLVSLGVVFVGEEGTAQCGKGTDRDSLCVDSQDLEHLQRGACERERCRPDGDRPCLWRSAYPAPDGDKFDEFVEHLARKHGSVPRTTSWRLHALETELMRAEEEERKKK